MTKTTAKAKPQIIYKPPPSEVFTATDNMLEYASICPVCEKRTIDVSELPEHRITLRYKCPHCRNVVTAPLVAAVVDEDFILSI